MKVSSNVRAAQFVFIANVALLFVASEISLHVQRAHASSLVVFFALIAAAAAFAGSLYIRRIGTGDAIALRRYWVPFAIVAIAFFGALSLALAVVFVFLAHRLLDVPAVREACCDSAPVPWLGW